MAWIHPDDVPTSVTRRAYGLSGEAVSQSTYAAVVADAYMEVREEVVRSLVAATGEVLLDPPGGRRDSKAVRATAELLGLPWQAVAGVLDVFAQEAARTSREKKERS